MTIAEAVRIGAAKLKEYNIDNAEHDSFEMLSDIMNINRTYYLVHGKDELETVVYDRFMSYIERRCKHEPLQHILGKAWFYGNEFVVNKNVLVPRPDTEILVEEALKNLKDGDNVLDMCTGSGCIILTLALNRKLRMALGVDLSEPALEVAQNNKVKLDISNVTLLHSDLFENVSSYVEQYDSNGMENVSRDIKNNSTDKNKFDMIVSNPPYIETAVIDTLAEEVRLHDPMMALDGFDDGLHFYRLITKQAVNYIKQGGWLMYEIGHNQAQAVIRLMHNAGFTDITVVKDYVGLDRVVRGRLATV